MKKSVKILAAVTAFILIGGILWFANGFLGNPISKALANNTAKKYIAKNYSNMNLHISEVSYSFKDGNYHAYVKSPTSKDTYFNISISPLGKLQYDSYENDVTKRNNTYIRLNEEYGEKVKEVFEDKNFPYKSDIFFGELKEITSKELESEYNDFGPVYGIDLSKLELDKSYDINEMGKKYGHIVFYAKDEDISIKKASEILLHIKKILDEKNVSFYAMDFSLQKPRSEDENINPNDKSIDIQEFLYSDIYEKGLENRIKENSQKLEKYYEEQDKIKDKQEQLIKEQEE